MTSMKRHETSFWVLKWSDQEAIYVEMKREFIISHDYKAMNPWTGFTLKFHQQNIDSLSNFDKTYIARRTLRETKTIKFYLVKFLMFIDSEIYFMLQMLSLPTTSRNHYVWIKVLFLMSMDKTRMWFLKI